MTRTGWYGLIAALALAGCATEKHGVNRNPIGTVQGVFVEHHPGVLVDRAVAGDPGARPTWAWVSFSEPLDDGRTFATARVYDDPGLEAGDLVRMQLADRDELAPGGTQQENLIVALIAKGGAIAGARPPQAALPVANLEPAALP
jgi:hypothetical protein